MQWAYSANTQSGDMNVFKRKNKWVLIEATDNGYIELSSGHYKEMKNLEQIYRTATDEIYGNLESIRIERGTDTWDLLNSGNRRNDDRNGGQIGSKKIQADTKRNNEHLLSGDREISDDAELKLSDREISYSKLTQERIDDLIKYLLCKSITFGV